MTTKITVEFEIEVGDDEIISYRKPQIIEEAISGKRKLVGFTILSDYCMCKHVPHGIDDNYCTYCRKPLRKNENLSNFQ